MPPTIQFHLDESCTSAIADGLRRRGISVTTTADVGIMGSSDERQLEFAESQRRVLMTHDHHFLSLHHRGVQHAGIAYCRPGTRTIGEIIRGLVLISQALTSVDMQNHVEFL